MRVSDAVTKPSDLGPEILELAAGAARDPIVIAEIEFEAAVPETRADEIAEPGLLRRR